MWNSVSEGEISRLMDEEEMLEKKSEEIEAIEKALRTLSSPEMLQTYETLDRLGDADVLRLLTGQDADTKALLGSPMVSPTPQAHLVVKIIQDLRSIGRKVRGLAGPSSGGAKK